MKSRTFILLNIFFLFFLFIPICNYAQTPLAANGRLKVIDRQLCNEGGRPIQLRGMSSHGLQWYGACMTQGSVQALANSWGCDVLRAAMYIDEGGYGINRAGLTAKVDSITDWSEQAGMYCIIDWHLHEPGNPMIHLTEAVDFFRQKAQKNGGKKHVIYEICNEPSYVTWDIIKSYAEQVIPVIRQYDPEAIILVGTPNWSGTPADVTSNPLTGANAYNVMYTFHFYAGAHFSQNYIDGVLQNIPLFISEWGTTHFTGNTGNNYVNSQSWLDLMAGANTANIKVSWCNWSFADKAETSAVLLPGSCADGAWNNTSESGTWVKDHILNPPDTWGSNIRNVPPSVSLTSPQNNASFSPRSTINIAAKATDADGKVDKVDFYEGTTLLGTSTTRPFTFSWANVPFGNYTLTTVATDDSAAVTTSTVVNIVVKNLPPSVSIVSPKNNAAFSSETDITISANATDADGTITKVEFYKDTTFLGTDSVAPYSFLLQNLPIGNYSLTAVATDDSSAVATSPVVNVAIKKFPPIVAITSPKNNAILRPLSNISIAATAKDSDGTIIKVDFYAGTTLLGSDKTLPYSFSWASVPAGNYTLTAVATDDNGLVTRSAVVNIIVKNLPPLVNITAPKNNAVAHGPANITISANATDSDGSIAKIDFYNDTTLLGSDNKSPYSFSWANVPNGNYALKAVATDNNGVTTTSEIVHIEVTNLPPSVSITSPKNNDSFNIGKSITISATATDPDGSVAKVDFYDGIRLLGSDNRASYSFSLANAAIGNHALTAVTTDNDGAMTTSAVINIVVKAASSADMFDDTSENLTNVLASKTTKNCIVSPIPSKHIFSFTTHQNIQNAKVFDQLGVEKINLQALEAGQSRNFGEYLPSGIYFLTIRYEDNAREVIKLIKVN